MGYVCTADLFRVAEDGQENAQLEVDSIVTASLIGQKEVQPQLVDYLGEKSLLFVFSVRAHRSMPLLFRCPVQACVVPRSPCVGTRGMRYIAHGLR